MWAVVSSSSSSFPMMGMMSFSITRVMLRIAVTFFNDIGQPAFGECFDCRWVFLFKLFFLLFLRGIDAMGNQ